MLSAFVQDNFLALQNRFEALGSLTDMDVRSTWSVLASAVLEVASSTIGFKRNIKQPWMTESTFNTYSKRKPSLVIGGRFRSTEGFRGCSTDGQNWTALRTATD